MEAIVLHVPEELSQEVFTAKYVPFKAVTNSTGGLTYTAGGDSTYFTSFAETLPKQIILPQLTIPKKDVSEFILTDRHIRAPFLGEIEGYLDKKGNYLTFRSAPHMLSHTRGYFSGLRHGTLGIIGRDTWIPANFPVGIQHKYLEAAQIEKYIVGYNAVQQLNSLYYKRAASTSERPLPVLRGHADDAIAFGSTLWLANAARPTILNNLLAVPILKKFGVSEESVRRDLAWSKPLRRAIRTIVDNTFPRIEATINGGVLFGTSSEQLRIPGSSRIELFGKLDIEKVLYAPHPPTLYFPISAVTASSKLTLSEVRLSVTKHGLPFLAIRYATTIRLRQGVLNIWTHSFDVTYRLKTTALM